MFIGLIIRREVIEMNELDQFYYFIVRTTSDLSCNSKLDHEI